MAGAKDKIKNQLESWKNKKPGTSEYKPGIQQVDENGRVVRSKKRGRKKIRKDDVQYVQISAFISEEVNLKMKMALLTDFKSAGSQGQFLEDAINFYLENSKK